MPDDSVHRRKCGLVNDLNNVPKRINAVFRAGYVRNILAAENVTPICDFIALRYTLFDTQTIRIVCEFQNIFRILGVNHSSGRNTAIQACFAVNFAVFQLFF